MVINTVQVGATESYNNGEVRIQYKLLKGTTQVGGVNNLETYSSSKGNLSTTGEFLQINREFTIDASSDVNGLK